MPRLFAVLLASVLVVLQGAATASAQTFPTQTVRFIVPYGPGSGADITTRLLAERLTQRWGQPVIVENRPGGDGFVAINAFLSANDGHTLLYVPIALFAVHPYTHDKLPYDADRDLAPIANVTSLVLSVTSSAAMKTKTLREFFDRVKSEPGKHNVAAASGTSEFLISGFLKDRKLDMGRVPYRDITKAPADLSENRIQLLVSSLVIVQAPHKAGTVNILAVTSPERAASAPDIPTVKEAGFPELELESPAGFFGPKDMALPIRERIAADIRDVVEKNPSIAKRLQATGQFVKVQGPEDFAEGIKDLRGKLDKIAKSLGTKTLAK